MFDEYVYECSNASLSNSMLLVDHGLGEFAPYGDAFARHGFIVVGWEGDLPFRVQWEEALKTGARLAVMASPDDYVPYDVATLMERYDVCLGSLFPGLDGSVLASDGHLDLDFLAVAYERDFVSGLGAEETRRYLERSVNTLETAHSVCDALCSRLVDLVTRASGYRDWMSVAELKARIDVTSARYGFDCGTNALTDGAFRDFMMKGYGALGGELDNDTPVLVSRAMEYMSMPGRRFAAIVMDGMSEFDWTVLRASLCGIEYRQSAVFAMVPTITSVSRQCLLSDKFPVQLKRPWSQSGEEREFRDCARVLGFDDDCVAYVRGYDVPLPQGCSMAAFIIMDVDERVHGQYGGRQGMLCDMEVLARGGRLRDLVRRLTVGGFDVYITADHGNTPCVGRGRVSQTGVETETKGKRVLVVNALADAEGLKAKYGLIEFPGTFLDKGYRYLLCPSGTSFDDPGRHVMSHGGISIDEVIVPFVYVKAVDDNC